MSPQRFPAIAAAANDLRRELDGQRNVTTQVAMLARLTTDERMKTVWHEFYKKKRPKKPSPELRLPVANETTRLHGMMRSTSIPPASSVPHARTC